MSAAKPDVPTLSSLGEFGLLRALGVLGNEAPRTVNGFLGPGDDTAVLPGPAGPLLFTADALAEGVHFTRVTCPPADLGYKCVAVNASDVAAMGGTPLAFTLTLSAPGDLPVAWTREFLDGVREGADVFGCTLAGGDTTGASSLVVSVALVGSAPEGGAVFRSGARPGDDLYVTGYPGESAAGLRWLQDPTCCPHGPGRRLARRHLRPDPRMALGKRLGEGHLATSMIDVSDGLLQDLEHILRASAVGAVVEADRLPLSADLAAAVGTGARAMALNGGEDYELLFTAPASHRGAVAEAGRATGTEVHRLGRIRAKPGIAWVEGGRERPAPKVAGYTHFLRPETDR